MDSADHLEDRIRVRTSDGTTLDGDLLVGADGVHSAVRLSMWNIANREQPGQASIPEEVSGEYVSP